jgi:hypothetical protein
MATGKNPGLGPWNDGVIPLARERRMNVLAGDWDKRTERSRSPAEDGIGKSCSRVMTRLSKINRIDGSRDDRVARRDLADRRIESPV